MIRTFMGRDILAEELGFVTGLLREEAGRLRQRRPQAWKKTIVIEYGIFSIDY